MNFAVLIGVNLVIMAVFFVAGIYKFLQIEDKQKGNSVGRLRRSVLMSDLGVDEAELRQLVRDEHYKDAIQRLISDGELDRFTAEATIETLKKQEYRPFFRRGK